MLETRTPWTFPADDFALVAIPEFSVLMTRDVLIPVAVDAFAENVGSEDCGSMPAVTIDTSGAELTIAVMVVVPVPELVVIADVRMICICGYPAHGTVHP